MQRSIELAVKHGVAIGAHPSYPDKDNFGRLSMSLTPQALKETLFQQIQELSLYAHQQGTKLSHVKPHGALYHDLARNSELGRLFLEVVSEVLGETIIITAPNSIMFNAPLGPKHILWSEGFIDQAHQQFLSLCNGHITSIEGQNIPIKVHTCCIHSDHPNALLIAQRINLNCGNHEV